jgi:hypothetical protein
MKWKMDDFPEKHLVLINRLQTHHKTVYKIESYTDTGKALKILIRFS